MIPIGRDSDLDWVHKLNYDIVKKKLKSMQCIDRPESFLHKSFSHK